MLSKEENKLLHAYLDLIESMAYTGQIMDIPSMSMFKLMYDEWRSSETVH